MSDGRAFRGLVRTFTQVQMFDLKGKIPSHESIMGIRELEKVLKESGSFETKNGTGWWRSGEYGFYPKGFEKEDLPLGDKIVYIEKGISYTLEVPDVPVMLASGGTVGLRQAFGMGAVRLEKLKLIQTDEKAFSVSVTNDFDPANDLIIKCTLRPRCALVDLDGYYHRSRVLYAEKFEDGATGWHGSLGHSGFRQQFYACNEWSRTSAVALIEFGAATIIEETSREMMRCCEKIVRGTPEQPEAAVKLLEQLKK